MRSRNWVLVAMMLSGCGDRRAAVLAHYRPAYDSLRVELRGLAPLVDTAMPQMSPAPADPLPDFFHWGDGNGAAIMADYLSDSDGDHTDPELSFTYPGLKVVMSWVEQPQNSAVIWEDIPPKELERELEAGLRWRYLLAVRVLSWEEPVVTESTFVGGLLMVRGVLLDRATSRVLCAVDVSQEPPAAIDYSYHQGFAEDRTKAMMAVDGAIFDSARTSLGRNLTACGGRFLLEL